MWDSQVVLMVAEGTWVTLYMTLASTLIAYLLGLPMGIALVVTAPGGLKPNKIIYKILDVVVNIVRSIPFLILLMLLIPFTKLIVGRSYGATATIVPLSMAAAPFVARLVESSLLEVDHGVVEAAQSMGAGTWRYCHPLRLLQIPGRHYDRYGSSSGSTGTDLADHWHQAFQEAGPQDHRLRC